MVDRPDFNYYQPEPIPLEGDFEALIKQADAQLAMFPPLKENPDFHPYYWAGVLRAAKRLQGQK